MKRPITNLVLGWMALFLSCFQLNAQTTFAVDPQNVTGSPGDQITVDFIVNDFTNILNFQYSMTWDPAIIEWVNPVTVSGELNGLSATSSFGTNNAGNGVMTVSWLDPDVAGVTLPNGTVLYSLTFDVLSSNGTEIEFGNDPTVIEVVDGNGNPVQFVGEEGVVNGGSGNGGGGGGNGDDLIVTIDQVSGANGTNTCLNFSVQNFTNILNFQYSMHFDPTVIEYTGVDGLNLPGLVTANFGANNAGMGTVTLSWLDPDVAGVTVPDGTVIYQMCFDIIGAGGETSNITVDGNPTVIEVVDGNSDPVNLSVLPGSVTVDGGSPPPPPPPVDGFAIIASDETIETGDNFCINFSVQDFDNILSMQYTMEYDENQLEFTGVDSLNLDGLASANINNFAPGIITISWLDPNVSGLTLPDGEVIYQICFDAIGANNCNNSTQLTFTGTQTPIEVLDGNEDEVDFNSVAGVISICDDPNGGGGGGGGGTPTNLTFTATDNSALPGETLCVDVSTDLFDCVVSAQFSMHFDPNVLQFTEVDNLNLPGLVSSQFGTVNADNGTVTFSWLDPDVSGVTVPNGTVIFSICYNVVGDLGDSSPLTFDGNPTLIEVTDCNPTNPTPDFVGGTQTIEASCPGPVSITDAITNNIQCNGAMNGTIDISVSGGNNIYTYQWTNSAGDNVGDTEDLANLGPGTYTVLVSSCNGLETATEDYFISQPSSSISINGTATPVPCFGATTGSIDISVAGGTTGGGCNYTYEWSNGATNQDISNIAQGTYVVTITDCNSCTATEDFDVLGPASELVSDVIATANLCNGDCNGMIEINASGGLPPYQYKLQGPWSGVNKYNNLCAGSYLAQVRDAFGCEKSEQIIVSAPPALAASATSTSAVNGDDGSIDLSVSGGSPSGFPPYSYSWEGPNGYTSTDQDIDNLLPGDYCVTVTDNNDCTTDLCENIQAPLVLTGINSTPTCFGQCIGQLEVSFTGGTAPYTYVWSSGDNGQMTDDDLCPGTYTVTITSTDGQTATMSGDVDGSSQIIIDDVEITHVSAQGADDGEIELDVIGGTMPLTYQWSNGGGTGNPITVDEGTYIVTITDANGCTQIGGAAPNDEYEVQFIPDQLTLTVAGDILCQSDIDDGGTLIIVVQGGVPPYNFTFTGGLDPVMGFMGNQLEVTGVAPGNYTVTVTDSATGQFTQTEDEDAIIELVDMELDPVVITPVTNGDDGAIDITVVGGDPIYGFTWNVSPVPPEDQSNLDVGSYEVFVKDANGCIELFGPFQVERMMANASVVQTACPADNNGSITLSPSGSPNLPYTYSWSNGAGNVSSITDLGLGQYTVTITDAIGASITETFIIDSQSNMNATAVQEGDILCFGDATGAAAAYPVDGVGSYSYEWSNGGNTQLITDLSAGDYIVTITDGVGCTVIKELEIIQPDELLVNVSVGEVNDCTNGNGTAEAMLTGGFAPFTYQWDDPLAQTSKKAILLSPGPITVLVTDDNGCTASDFDVVEAFDSLVVEGVSIPDSGGPNGQAIAVVKSGTYPYTFEWRDYPTPDSVLTELLPGVYYVKVTDAKGCETLIDIKVDDETTCLMASAIITPEGDGFNEAFQIGCLSRFPDNRLEVYNRWGQMVFLANDYNNDNLWRGTNRRGNEVPDGVYFYVFEYVDPATGIEDSLKGAVTVARK